MDETKARPRPRKTTAKAVARASAKNVPQLTAAAAKRPRKAPPPVAADRESMVRMAAFFRAERRGFAPGYEIEDWLAAEAEVSGLEQAKPAAKPRKTPARKPRTG